MVSTRRIIFPKWYRNIKIAIDQLNMSKKDIQIRLEREADSNTEKDRSDVSRVLDHELEDNDIENYDLEIKVNYNRITNAYRKRR